MSKTKGQAMRKQKVLGYYVVNAAGEQVAWHKLRRKADKIAVDYSKRLGGVFHVQPEFEEAV
jgi:hypothetical protein